MTKRARRQNDRRRVVVAEEDKWEYLVVQRQKNSTGCVENADKQRFDIDQWNKERGHQRNS